MQLIDVRGLNVRYENLEVLTSVDLSVEAGEFVSVIGKSGSGKSTLLHALARFIPSTGEILMSDNLGMVFQNFAIFPWLTVSDNIAVGLRGQDPLKRHETVSKLLMIIGLAEHADKYPGQLSGGQAQRVAIARALAPDPDVIFMDEPFGALDHYTRERMQEWLTRVWEQTHKTVIFVTHSIEEAVFLSDRVVLLEKGRIVEQFLIGLRRPRDSSVKFTPEFVNLRRRILDKLEEEMK